MMTNPRAAMRPTTGRERHVVLDALRGLALLGIALANFPEFGLWTFLSSEAQSLQPTAAADRIVRFLQYMLVDGKFYTIFCLLFVKVAIEQEPNHACMNSDEREQARQKGKDTERRRGSALFTMLAAPGRMALTNYISQSLIGILLFYGLGLGLGTGFGLICIELTALIVFLVQILLSCLWLRYFRFGPLEWLWRILGMRWSHDSV